jgi:hypothetical protein
MIAVEPSTPMGIPSMSPVVLGPDGEIVVLGPTSEGLIVKVRPFEMIVVGLLNIIV